MSILKKIGKSLFGSGDSGDGGAGARAEEEERRKAELRRRIDSFYGIDTSVAGPTPVDVSKIPNIGNIRGQITDRYNAETARVNEENSAFASQVGSARAAMEGENTKLSDATRAYYTDQLGDRYEEAERNTRFKLARQGLLGGSEDAGQLSKVKEDRDLGATRIDEAVRRAVANLVSQREQERLNAINLVNSGAGDSAVSAAQAGLRNSFETVSNAQKADIFSDLFANSADAIAAGNLADNQSALLGRYRERLSTFFPAGSSSSGRVTPSA